MNRRTAKGSFSDDLASLEAGADKDMAKGPGFLRKNWMLVGVACALCGLGCNVLSDVVPALGGASSRAEHAVGCVATRRLRRSLDSGTRPATTTESPATWASSFTTLFEASLLPKKNAELRTRSPRRETTQGSRSDVYARRCVC